MYTFEAVKGHENIIRHMRNAINGRRVGHAFIFNGAKGMGKKMLAKTFAKTLQCESGGDAPCHTCLSCRVFESGNHPDVIYVKAAKTVSIGVDDVREQIISPMHEKPFRYRYKIFIVDSADTLTPAAQNALLKTIEEPAPYGVVMLLAAYTYHFLPTVLSRCVMLPLKPLSDELVIRALVENGLPEPQARMCAAFAKGNIGSALETAASQEFADIRQLALSVARQIHRYDLPTVFKLYTKFEPWKALIVPLLDMLYICYRDMLALKQASGGDCFVFQRDQTEALAHAASEIPLKALFNSMDAITRTRRVLRHNGNFQLAIELMLLQLNGQKI